MMSVSILVFPLSSWKHAMPYRSVLVAIKCMVCSYTETSPASAVNKLWQNRHVIRNSVAQVKLRNVRDLNPFFVVLAALIGADRFSSLSATRNDPPPLRARDPIRKERLVEREAGS